MVIRGATPSDADELQTSRPIAAGSCSQTGIDERSHEQSLLLREQPRMISRRLWEVVVSPPRSGER